MQAGDDRVLALLRADVPQCKKPIIVLVQEDVFGIVLDRVFAARRAVHSRAPRAALRPSSGRAREDPAAQAHGEACGTVWYAEMCRVVFE